MCCSLRLHAGKSGETGSDAADCATSLATSCSSTFRMVSEWFYASKEACKFGDVEIVQWVMEHPIGVSLSEAYSHHSSAGPEHFFCLAAAGGHIEVMEYLFAEGFYDNFKDAARLAIQNNHFDALEWLLQHHTYFSEDFMIEEAAKNGRLEMVKYFHSIDKYGDSAWLSPFGNAMDVASGHNQLPVVEWLQKTRPEGCTTRAMDNAAANGHLHMLQWLHYNRTEGCTKKAMDKAAANGHLEVVQWLHCNRSEGCTTGAMDSAAANGHLNVVKWLFLNRSEKCTVKAIEKALENSHVRVAYWLQTHIPMWAPSVDTLQINDPNQFDILLFLDWYIPNIFNPSDPDQPRLAMITEPKDNHAVAWMKEKHNVQVDSHR